MASITIRGLDEATKAGLRVRAAMHGRSMEAEVRSILDAAVADERPDTDLATYFTGLFAGIGPVDTQRTTEAPRSADLS